MIDTGLVVHVATRPRAVRLPADDPTGRTVHVAIGLRPRPDALAGADLVVAHDALAQLVARARTRGRDIGVARADDAGAAPTPTAAAPHPTPLGATDRLRLLPAATRLLGDELLVAGPGPDRSIEVLSGTGPDLWERLGSGATIAGAAEALAEATGASPPEVEAAVLHFARMLIEVGLAEPKPSAPS